MQAKYECTQKHGSIKVISPDWVLDSVDVNLRLEEEQYHPSHLRRVETDHRVSMGSCNGAIQVEEIPTLARVVPRSEATPTMVKGLTVTSGQVQVQVTEVSIPEATTATHHVQQKSSQAAATTVKREEQATPTSPKCEQLLDGVVLHFTDYQDCVETDTLEKWKLVSRTLAT